MCGIWATFGNNGSLQSQIAEALKVFHRGPDAFRFERLHGCKKSSMGFSHLSIVGSPLGMQPMRLSQHPHLVLMFNGEIYNYKKIFKAFNIEPESDSDGECILHLYNKGGIEFAASLLDGVFAFCLFDSEKKKIFLGRDSFGVKPLYRYLKDGTLTLCSEYKGLVAFNDLTDTENVIQCILPGTVETYLMHINEVVEFESSVKFHNFSSKPKWNELDGNPQLGEDISENIRTLLTEAVRKRLMTHRRLGCFLSGGLDSSLVAALVVKIARETGIKYPIQTFSIGLSGSFDLAAAKKVADYLGTEHHEVVFKPEEGHKLIEKVIYHLESYDSFTIPSATAQYILCNYIRTNTDTVVIMSGEGADEVAQGYQYFYNAPTPEEADAESRNILETMHVYTVQRVDRITSAHGLEVRVPFLDHNFIHYYLSLPAELRVASAGTTEKYLIRKAFEGLDLIPSDVLWRKKAEFGAGVSSEKQSWLKAVRDYAESMVPETDWQKKANQLSQFKHCPATTKSKYYHQATYDKHFSNCAHLIPDSWTTKWNGINPSLVL